MTKPNKKFNPLSVLGIALAAVFAMWVVMGSFPTGWIYDIGKGSGTAVGMKPDDTVQQLTGAETLSSMEYWKDVPFTVTSDTFIFAPLTRLRDPRAEGVHRGNRSRGYTKTVVELYGHLKYPIDTKIKILYSFGMASLSNNYYLVQLADGSYVCAFFDDYHMMQKWFKENITLPTGYIRFADGNEQKMLQRVSTDYEVNTALVLDMYNDDKLFWVFDMSIRMVLAFVGIWFALAIKGFVKKRLVGKES